jgi:hypothetical protein
MPAEIRQNRGVHMTMLGMGRGRRFSKTAQFVAARLGPSRKPADQVSPPTAFPRPHQRACI